MAKPKLLIRLMQIVMKTAYLGRHWFTWRRMIEHVGSIPMCEDPLRDGESKQSEFTEVYQFRGCFMNLIHHRVYFAKWWTLFKQTDSEWGCSTGSTEPILDPNPLLFTTPWVAQGCSFSRQGPPSDLVVHVDPLINLRRVVWNGPSSWGV